MNIKPVETDDMALRMSVDTHVNEEGCQRISAALDPDCHVVLPGC